LLAVFSVMCAGYADDWPTYRHDISRNGITSERLKMPLHEQWTFTSKHAPEPAWPEPVKELARVRFDNTFQVAVDGGRVYFGSSADGKVYALDAKTGKVRWAALTEGPVRLAPTVWKRKVFVGSDDGHAYCMRARDGKVLWKVRAAYSDEKVLGNGKMISLWPVRTSVAVDDGVAYFGAGVFPSEGLYVCAVRAKDGEIVWRNDTCGEEQIAATEYGGISPQGYLLASDTTLYVPSGRAMPAAFDREDGRFRYFCNAGGKYGGTWALLTEDQMVAGVNRKVVYDRRGKRTGDAAYAWFPGIQLVVDEGVSYMVTHNDISALDRQAYLEAKGKRAKVVAERGKVGDKLSDLERQRSRLGDAAPATLKTEIAGLRRQMDQLSTQQKSLEDSVRRWQRPFDCTSSLIMAGDILFAGGENKVVAIDAATGKQVWSCKVDGDAGGLAVSGDRLFVSTDTGAIYCFGEKSAKTPGKVIAEVEPAPYPKDEMTPVYAATAESIVRDTGVTKGYCLVLGCGTGRLAFELAKRTDLDIIGIEEDAGKVERAREALDGAGLYGSRVIVDHGSLSDLPYADYFANLIVSETPLVSSKMDGSAQEMYRVLKPCGGVAYFGQPAGVANQIDSVDLARWTLRSDVPTPEITTDNGVWAKIVRGPLKGAGSWTHQYADPANTACSTDELVKSPIGVLWFGEPGPERMVERHARAAAPVAMDGRMFVQGEHVVMAFDSYNGVRLWERQIPGAVRVRVDSDMSNLALTEDSLYVATGDKCLRLDPATGETVATYTLPPAEDGKPRRWGYVARAGNMLFGSTAEPVTMEYGASWDQLVTADGRWRDPSEMPGSASGDYARYTAEFPTPDARAYAEFEYRGGMWRYVAPFPAWGSVRTPEGSVTERIMASDSVFGIDTQTGTTSWVYKGGDIAHPAIAIADGMLFLADCSVPEEKKLAAIELKKGLIANGIWEDGGELAFEPDNADVRRVVAIDAVTGETRWERWVDLTGCGGDRMGMAYHDGVLLFFGCFSNHDRDMFYKNELAWRRITAINGADGSDIWSRPLNYLRRPVVMSDTIILEPRACDLYTGSFKMRTHPLTGEQVPWEFVRAGHCCSITSASPDMFFLRGYFAWFYDMNNDQGIIPFGGTRPGCWINMIPANGLMLFPEASSGCRCSYPVRSSVVFTRKENKKPWSIFIQQGEMTPVKHMAINLGAPGDMRDDDGNLWFGYPRPLGNTFLNMSKLGVKFDLNETILPSVGYFKRSFQGIQINDTDKPWVFASGCTGLTQCTLRLVDEGQQPGRYTVRLLFSEPTHRRAGKRVFDVKLQGKVVLEDFDIAKAAGEPNTAVVKEFKGIPVSGDLAIELVSKDNKPGKNEAPLINGIQVIEELAIAAAE